MYYVHWKSLLFLGFIFWLLLCATDLLADPKTRYYRSIFTVERLMNDQIMDTIVEEKVESQLKNLDQERAKFGWSLLLWNFVAFIVTFVFCSIIKSMSWFVWNTCRYCRNRRILAEMRKRQFAVTAPPSKIPVLISKSTTTIKSSDDSPRLRPIKFGEDDCCFPAVLTELDPSHDHAEKTCQMIFKNNKMFSPTLPLDRQLQSQCAKLREEMLIVQATSLKEHAALSRKLEAVSKEKRELSKQLAVSHKENRAAKQQLEELLAEKTMLLKRLDNATKEFKNNTKSKKVALAKLEEVSGNAETLKQKLEQVTRDKQILESKLKVLEVEFEKLKERLRLYQRGSDRIESHMPERDENVTTPPNVRSSEMLSTIQEADSEFSAPSRAESLEVDPSVSETEIDMKKIQMKIKELEKNLENFNPKKPEFGGLRNDTLKPEIDNENKDSTDSSCADLITPKRSPQQQPSRDQCSKSCTNIKRKSSEGRGEGETFSMMAQSFREKIKRLEMASAENHETSGTTPDPDSSSDEGKNSKPTRVVSSSLAFQIFMKNFNTTELKSDSFYKQMR